MADDEIVVGSFEKNSREDVRITLSKFKGYDLAGVRVWYKGDTEDDMRPSKTGITVRVELLPKLLAYLTKAKDIALEKGLIVQEDLEVDIED